MFLFLSGLREAVYCFTGIPFRLWRDLLRKRLETQRRRIKIDALINAQRWICSLRDSSRIAALSVFVLGNSRPDGKIRTETPGCWTAASVTADLNLTLLSVTDKDSLCLNELKPQSSLSENNSTPTLFTCLSKLLQRVLCCYHGTGPKHVVFPRYMPTKHIVENIVLPW